MKRVFRRKEQVNLYRTDRHESSSIFPDEVDSKSYPRPSPGRRFVDTLSSSPRSLYDANPMQISLEGKNVLPPQEQMHCSKCHRPEQDIDILTGILSSLGDRRRMHTKYENQDTNSRIKGLSSRPLFPPASPIELCRYFPNCKYGNSCKYAHDIRRLTSIYIPQTTRGQARRSQAANGSTHRHVPCCPNPLEFELAEELM